MTRRFTHDLPALRLDRFHLDMGTLNQKEIDWLQSQGVSRKAIIQPWPIGACTAVFDGNYFEPDPEGERAITIAITDSGHIIDIAAWAPRSGQMASYLGMAFCIEPDEIFNPGTYFGGSGLMVHETPLSWLAADRDGIVILRPELAYSYLSERDRVVVTSAEFGQRLQDWLKPPDPTVEILVLEEEVAA